MIRARESSDNWAHRAHHILDQAREGHGRPEHIEWALAYLNDKEGCTKIPRDLMGSQSQAVPA
jgi:hypothetical protein